MPFDMVDPMLRSIGFFVKKFFTPILSRLVTPGVTFLWQTLGTVVNASAMIPIVGVATGAIGAIHSQLTTPIMIYSGMIPEVVVATTSVSTLSSCIISCLNYLAYGKLPLIYGSVFATCSGVGSIFGIYISNYIYPRLSYYTILYYTILYSQTSLWKNNCQRRRKPKSLSGLWGQ